MLRFLLGIKGMSGLGIASLLPLKHPPPPMSGILVWLQTQQPKGQENAESWKLLAYCLVKEARTSSETLCSSEVFKMIRK